MGAPDSRPFLPPASALHKFLTAHPPPANSPHTSDHHNLALQIAHNLHYQHLWTHIYLHTAPPGGHDKSASPSLLPRPLLSGLPPRRLYIHPDEQIELLQKQKDRGKSGMPEVAREREWVLPSHLREKWSLHRFGEVFDAISAVPSTTTTTSTTEDEARLLFGELSGDSGTGEGGEEGEEHKWREVLPKRVVLATLDDDSTVVYYIVHDGIVKPRQN